MVAINFKDVFRKTLGSVKPSYIIRHYIFAFALIFLIYMLSSGGAMEDITKKPLYYLIFCGLLYPYTRLLFDMLVSFIVGNNLWFALPFMRLIFIEALVTGICLLLAPFVTPFSLIGLYIYYTYKERKQLANSDE